MKFKQVAGLPLSIGDVQPGDVFTFDARDRFTRTNITDAFRRAGDEHKLMERGLENEKFLKLSGTAGFVWLREDDLLTFDENDMLAQEELRNLKVRRVWRVRRVEMERVK